MEIESCARCLENHGLRAVDRKRGNLALSLRVLSPCRVLTLPIRPRYAWR